MRVSAAEPGKISGPADVKPATQQAEGRSAVTAKAPWVDVDIGHDRNGHIAYTITVDGKKLDSFEMEQFVEQYQGHYKVVVWIPYYITFAPAMWAKSTDRYRGYALLYFLIHARNVTIIRYGR